MGVGIVLAVGGATAGLFAYQALEVSSAVAGLDSLDADVPWTSTSKKTKKRRTKAMNIVRKLTNLEPSESVVIERLNGEANTGLEGAMVAAGDMESPGAVPKLIEFLKGEDERQRKVAGFALGLYTPCPKELPALLSEELSPEVREAVYSALSRSHDKEARLKVAEGLKESDPAIRAIAVKALGRNNTKEAHAALVDALEDESPDVGDAAVKALNKKTESGRSKEGLKKLRAMVDSERPEVRARALTVCAMSDQESVGEKGEGYLADADPAVAAAAALLMQRLTRREAAPKLVQLLVRTEPEVVEAATNALKELGGSAEGTEEALVEMLAHQQVHTRIGAATLLAYLQDLPVKKVMRSRPWKMLEKPFVPRLLDCLQSGDQKLIEAAHAALTALQKSANFKNDNRNFAAWKQWHEMVLKERAQMEKIWALCDPAFTAFDERKQEEYNKHARNLREAVNLYGELIEMGSRSKYEHGDYGITEINKTIIIMSKTSKVGGG
jgi:HEAT repeat protein